MQYGIKRGLIYSLNSKVISLWDDFKKIEVFYKCGINSKEFYKCSINSKAFYK